MPRTTCAERLKRAKSVRLCQNSLPLPISGKCTTEPPLLIPRSISYGTVLPGERESYAGVGDAEFTKTHVHTTQHDTT